MGERNGHNCPTFMEGFVNSHEAFIVHTQSAVGARPFVSALALVAICNIAACSAILTGVRTAVVNG